MKTRTIGLLLGALLLLALVAFLGDRADRRHTSGGGPGGKLFPGLDPAAVVKLEIRTPAKTFTLEKTQGAWKVTPEGFAADEEGVKEALAKLGSAEKAELASQNPAKHEALQVKDADPQGVEVKAWTKAPGAPAAHLLIGKPGPDYQSSFVRVQGDSNVYRTREMVRNAFDRGTRGWRDRTVIKFDAESAERIELTSSEGKIVLEKPQGKTSKDATEVTSWHLVEPEAGPAKDAAVDTILRTLSTLQADEFATETDPAKTGLTSPAARSLVKLKDGKQIELLWGADATAGRVYAKRADSDTVVELGSYRKTAVFQKLADLKPPAPPPSAPVPAPALSASPAPK